jgi:hypothetical protein
MNLKYFVISIVMLVGGLTLLIFNKQIGLFLYQNEPKVWNFLNPRQRVLFIGFVLVLLGVSFLIQTSS